MKTRENGSFMQKKHGKNAKDMSKNSKKLWKLTSVYIMLIDSISL